MIVTEADRELAVSSVFTAKEIAWARDVLKSEELLQLAIQTATNARTSLLQAAGELIAACGGFTARSRAKNSS